MIAKEPMDITILYVEDDRSTREEIERMLRRRCARVLTAENGSDGLALFHSNAPDLVITDILMPVMDGLAMARAVHQIDSEIRIIATTAHSDTSHLLEAIETGIDHYVLKPVDAVKLMMAVEKCGQDVFARKALKRHHEERERLIAELQAAADEIKTLRGILPICSYCKNIRNDKGYWEQVEAYISRNSNLLFSHSICPSCLRIHFPEHYEAIMAGKDPKNGE